MDDTGGEDCVVLTGSPTRRSIPPSGSYESDETEAYRVLKPLKRGSPVVLFVDDPKLPKRKRVERPRLFLTPLSVYGPPSRYVLASLEAHGSEVLDTSMKIPTVSLMRLGLNVKLAAGLAVELNRVFNVKE